MARQVSQREYILLGLLLVIAVVYLLYTGAGGFGGDAATGQLEATEYGDAPVVHMARLRMPAEGYDGAGRSLFRYYTPPPPKAPPIKQPERVRRPPKQAPPPRAKIDRPPPAPRGTKPPRITFDYVGFLGPKEAKIAVFEKDDTMMLARVGDTIENHFRLMDFKYEAVVIGYTDEKFKDESTELEQQNR